MDAGRRVLVVDDDAGIRTMLELALRSEGYCVEVAAAARDALAHLAERPPHLVLVDVLLRDGSGTLLARSIRDEHGIPVILMSADDRRAPVAEAAVQPFLQKPFDLADLFGAVERLLGPVGL